MSQDRNIKIVVEYKGTRYAGWQMQENATTIQELITEALKRVTGKEITLHGAGRTDAGVHALGQVANFHIEHELEPSRYADAVNYYLPDDIRIKSSIETDLSFHSRFSAKFRRYRYLLSPERSALYHELRYELPRQFDYNLLQSSARLVRGEHDFSPFCVTASRKESNVCQVEFSRWYMFGSLYIYEIRGNRFLHSMVRSLVGSMINLSMGSQDNNLHNLTLGKFENILTGSTGERAVFTAPAEGLYLVSVGY
ncbi:MAG: tRNA pseudouridine(38-40) synthase TruA [candidate division Zixibacteria bacterium]|nr:tRNA pseudouridine(38-40) synthase TruA [candidate division Zixibacteria bacterium]